jgi:hypothetical protein
MLPAGAGTVQEFAWACAEEEVDPVRAVEFFAPEGEQLGDLSLPKNPSGHWIRRGR